MKTMRMLASAMALALMAGAPLALAQSVGDAVHGLDVSKVARAHAGPGDAVRGLDSSRVRRHRHNHKGTALDRWADSPEDMRSVYAARVAGISPDSGDVDDNRELGHFWDIKIEIAKYEGDIAPGKRPYEVCTYRGNVLATVGITRMLNLLIGAGGTAYNSTNTRIGVGDGNPVSKTGTAAVTNGSATVTGTSTAFTTDYAVNDWITFPGGDGALYQISAIGSSTSITLTANYAGSTLSGLAHSKVIRALAADTDLAATTGATTRQWKLVDQTPSVATNVVTFHATAATTDANFRWREFGIDNGTADGTAASTAPLLNHKITDFGLKTSAASWAITVTVTIT